MSDNDHDEDEMIAVDVEIDVDDDDDESDNSGEDRDKEEQSDDDSDDENDGEDEEELAVVVAEAVEDDDDDVPAMAEKIAEADIVEEVEEDDSENDEAQVVEEVVADDDADDVVEKNDDDDDEEVEAQAVVMEVGIDDDLDVEAEAVAVAVDDDDDDVEVEGAPSTKRIKTNSGTASRGKGSISKSTKNNPDNKTPLKKKSSSNFTTTTKNLAGKRKSRDENASNNSSKGKRGGKQKAGKTKASLSLAEQAMHLARIDSKRMSSANAAREFLYEEVPKMPFPVNTHPGDSYTVRSFGQLMVGDLLTTSNFCTPTSLYPVGFSCERAEFSPSHGRFLKLRCAILDGTRMGVDGPLFRIMWGQGIDEDKANDIEYPYDPFSNSAPITSSGGKGGENDDADDIVVAIPTSAGYQPSRQLAPAPGMRVKSRFDEDKYYYGTIMSVTEQNGNDGVAALASPSFSYNNSNSGKAKKGKKIPVDIKIKIKYDDGSLEESIFPDPDINLVMPGNDDELDDMGNYMLTELNGKKIHSVIGKNPLEAWGMALTQLGLIDEEIAHRAIEALHASRGNKVQESVGRGYSNKGSKHKQGDEERKMNFYYLLEAKEKGDLDTLDPDAEPYTDEEKFLRERVAALKEEYAAAHKKNELVATALIDARVALIGPMVCNPFPHTEKSIDNQASFIGVAVKKEKTKMGSTGNKRKIVLPTDLLGKNDTFFLGDIEPLIEGLPGSEYCTDYVYLKRRGEKEKERPNNGKESRHMLLQQRRRVEQAEREREMERAKLIRQMKEAKAREKELHEREIKRRKVQEERDEKKRQRLDEEGKHKKKRAEERMSKLSIQVNDRLKKEACSNREKIILIIAKNLSREMNRRRKAAETVAGQVVAESKASAQTLTSTIPDLPPLGKSYDEDILRMWDFLNVFKKFFIDRKFFKDPPSLDSLQNNIDALRETNSVVKGRPSKAEAKMFVTELAISLCKPLAAGLSRMLFASLIALNPGLQKKFNAAFWTEEGDAKINDNDEVETAFTTDVLVPVNNMTWMEVARSALLADSLGELGFSRQEVAHYLRGYRSTGHPNSKEAKRLGKVQDMDVEMLKQRITEFHQIDDGTFSPKIVRISTPSKPQSNPSDWTFYLHNVKSLKAKETTKIRKNIRKSLELLKKKNVDQSMDSYVSTLEESLSLISEDKSKDNLDGNKAREIVLKLMDLVTGEVYSRDRIGSVVDRDSVNSSSLKPKGEKPMIDSACKRNKMGELQTLEFSEAIMKDLVHSREEYMSIALTLKEDMKRQELKEAGEDVDDDDDEDDEDENENDEKGDVKEIHNKTGIDTPINQSPTSCGLVDERSPKLTPESLTEEKNKGVEVSTTDETASMIHASIKSDLKDPIKDKIEPAIVNTNGSDDMTRSKNRQVEDLNTSGPFKIGKQTDHEDFCGDLPEAHDLIRRCLAVLRGLVDSGPAEPFLLPVDPHTNPGYYDVLVRPMCLREVGLKLKSAAKKGARIEKGSQLEFVEKTVADFARNIRLIVRNTLSYANAGPMIISAGTEMLRVFERLLFDWVLVPEEELPALSILDDDLCVEPHSSDGESTVLLCDACEGNYNIDRLDPPLEAVPKGDWYCPRCLSGRWWGDVDPRIGKDVTLEDRDGPITAKIQKCIFSHPEGEDRSLVYKIKTTNGKTMTIPLKRIDAALSKTCEPPPKIRCLEAVTESTGYCAGIDNGFRRDLVPVLLNPNISDSAAQVVMTSSVFRDSISTAAILMINNSEDMTANEWLKLLSLLMMRCSSSDLFQTFASKMEAESAENMAKVIKTMKEKDSTSKLSYFKKALFSLPFQIDDENQIEIDNDDENNEKDHVKQEECNSGKIKSALPDNTKNINAEELKVEEIKPVAISSTEEKEDSVPVVVVGQNAVQVIAMEVDGETNINADVAIVEVNTPISEMEIFKKARTSSLREKAKRQKAREDGIASFCVKNQLKSTVASFEEDNVSHAIESCMVSRQPGLSFGSTRCRGKVCDLCGLSDTALGTNLVRMPNQKEWDEFIQHAARFRRTHLLADLRDENSQTLPLKSRGSKKLLKLSVRVGGDLITDEPDETFFCGIKDGGMLEFLPRNSDGFQDELLFRYNSGLPYISGSMTAHEGCAIAAHSTRKTKVIELFKEKQAALVEREAGISCGRTLDLGTDSAGRSYWHFYNDLESLYVCEYDSFGNVKWQKYSEPETISSIMISLSNCKDPVVQELKKTFPNSVKMICDKTWSELLLKRHFKVTELNHNSPGIKVDTEKEKDAIDEDSQHSSEEEEPYEEGESVLVESTCGSRLWDAKVVGVAKHGKSNQPKDLSYRVSYKSWSSRFDEWVSGDRVVEPSENNIEVQAEMVEDEIYRRQGLPAELEDMGANSYLNSRDRARGPLPLPPFSQIMEAGPHASENEKTFLKMKAALLAIEASLPIGSVNNSSKGSWRPDLASQWRLNCLQAEGPWALMRCVILLEDNIGEDWIHPDFGNLRSGLPLRMKALEEASPSSLAIRIDLFDRSIKYNCVDKKRHKPKKKKGEF